MIKVNTAIVEIKGREPMVCSEMVCLIKSFKEMLEEKHGNKIGEEIFNMILEDAQKSEQQIKEEAEKLLADLFKDIADVLMEIKKGR